MNKKKYTEEERKEKRKESLKKYNNKKERKEKLKNRYIDNKKEISEKQKKYYKDKKEKIKNKVKEYSSNNKDVIKEKKKKYYNDNIDIFKEKSLKYNNDINNKKNKKLYDKKYREVNKEKINSNSRIYKKKRRLNDPLFKLKTNIHRTISDAFRRKKFTKKSKAYIILGCTFDDFKFYIESKFEYWMTYENYGKYNGSLNYGWDLDHIIPLSTAFTESDIIKLNHYTNFQPLCSYVNRHIKKDKLIY